MKTAIKEAWETLKVWNRLRKCRRYARKVREWEEKMYTTLELIPPPLLDFEQWRKSQREN